MKSIFIALLFISALAFCDEKKTQVFVFATPKASCNLVDGKLILSKMWPLGSWEDCAYAVLSAAQQLDQQKELLAKQLADERSKPQPTCLGPVLHK